MYNFRKSQQSVPVEKSINDFSKSRTVFEIKYRKWDSDFQKEINEEMKLDSLKKFVMERIADLDFKNYIAAKLPIIFSEFKNEKDYDDFIAFLKTNGVIFND